jgi:hypothetical protein
LQQCIANGKRNIVKILHVELATRARDYRRLGKGVLVAINSLPQRKSHRYPNTGADDEISEAIEVFSATGT